MGEHIGPMSDAVADALGHAAGALETPVATYAPTDDGLDVAVGHATNLSEAPDGAELIDLPTVEAVCGVHLGPMATIQESRQKMHRWIHEAGGRVHKPDPTGSNRRSRVALIPPRAEWETKGATMIGILNRLVDEIEQCLHDHDDLDVDGLAQASGTTGYHARRMFSSLAGMSVSEYVRRRRMTVAAADVIGGEDLLTIAVRYGYGSTEAFGRAFRAVHGTSHGDVRRDGGPLRSQPLLRFRLTVEGSAPMDARITARPAFRLIGHAARVPLIHEGVNPHIQRHIAALPVSEHDRLKQLSSTEPAGLLQVSADVDPDYAEGSELTYLHGVAVEVATDVPGDLDVIEVGAGEWVVFRTSGPHPAALQEAYAASATEWFPANPWRLCPGPSIVSVLDRAPDFSTATCELWFPIERA